VLNHGVGPLARSLTRPSFSEPRVFADQCQRDGVTLGLRFGVRNGTPMLSVGEERAGFSGIFEIVAADKAGGGQADKGDPRRLPPLSTPSPPLLPNQPSHPCLTQGANWGRESYLNNSAGQLTVPNLTPPSRR
jgi:hypothetical protein